MLRAIIATGRVGLWVARKILFGGPSSPSRDTRLPFPFQSVAPKAFGFGEARPQPEAEGKPMAKSASNVRPRRRWFGRVKRRYRVLGGLVAAGGVALAITTAGMMVYYTIVFPDPLAVRHADRTPVIRILARDGSVVAERGNAHDFVPLDLMPKVLPAAVIATEDRRFFEHYGIDPVGMIRAMFANLRAGRFAQGGSTLTQQLAKNLFLTQDRTLARKIAEVGLALWLEVRLSKSEILELYLNQVYFGGGAYGVEAASQRYFDKSARDLDLAEAAVIAGLLKAPTKYSPATNPGAARGRSRVVLGRMLDAGFITADDEQRALDSRLVFSEPKIAKTPADVGYAVDYVLDELPSIIGGAADNDELIIETTLDADLQRHAQQIVSDTLAKKGAAFGATQGAVVVLDQDGGARALVGGRDFAESQFNRAIKAKRQPGSAFKPFVYLAALQHGMTPDTVASDQPITIGGWSPKNDNGQYLGNITLRRALAQSINTVAVRLNQDVGHGKTADIAERLGVRSDLHEGPSLALGTSEVTLLEMAGAYTAFANGGDIVEPHVITRVRLGSGRVLFESKAPRGARIADIAQIGALNDMLNAAVVYGTGKRAALAEQPVAGKTGTTQDFRDAWFVGYTSYLTAGVWIGNDNGKPMNRATGGSLPAEIWNQIMRVAHAGKVPTALPGTTYAGPQFGVADNASDLIAVTPAGPRAPRVIAAREVLPWLAQRNDAGTRRSSAGTGDDLIAQILARPPGETGVSADLRGLEPADRPSANPSFWTWW